MRNPSPNIIKGSRKIFWGVKGLATKPDDLSSIYKAHILEGKLFPARCFLAFMHAYKTQINVIKNSKLTEDMQTS